jgi:phosphoribosylformylglycinamidine cyclo-ligase
VGDLVRTIIVDSTFTARLKRDRVIDNANIAPGQVIVGLASFGQATYESAFNSGIGSNGLTAARHNIFHHDYATQYPETYDTRLDDSVVYAGPWRVTDKPEGWPLDMGRAVLSPTRTYAPVMREVLNQVTVHGAVHCSGGGQTKVLHFATDWQIEKDNLFPTPALFTEIQKATAMPWREMYQVFNMGIGMAVIVRAKDAPVICTELKGKVIGHIGAGSGVTRLEFR